ncbi:MAG: AarF/UbiB family protein [Acidimicrobiales bacterium]
MRVADVMQREVARVEPDATLLEAAQALVKCKASAAVVMDGDKPVGILTEHDLVQLVVDGDDSSWSKVSSRMSTQVVSVGPATDTRLAAALMSEHGIRHLVVMEANRLAGLVSFHDDLDPRAEESPSAEDGAEADRPQAPPDATGPRPAPFRGPYADGPPDSALVVDMPSLTSFRPAELKRMLVVNVVLTLCVLRRLLPSLLRIRRKAIVAAACKGLIEGFELLGPTYVKLGQLIASSPGIFPKALSDEALSCLDEVPPFDGRKAKEIIRQDLGRSVAELFTSFDHAPLAAASVGQVHACVLPDGRDAVVKLQRPDIRHRMGTDLRIMHRLARLLARFSGMARSANVVGIVEDLHSVTFKELNPVVEAHRQTRFRDGISAFGDNKWVTAPEIYWDYCGPNMICMERLYGFPVDEFDTVRARGIDAELVLRRGVKVWMEAALVHGAFHGDVHSGNLWMLDDGRLAFLDFGIMGELDDDWKQLLKDQFTTTILDDDFSRVARAFKRVGAFPEEAGTDEEVGMRMKMVFSAMLDSGLSDVNLGELLSSIVGMMDQYSKNGTPRELVLVIKQLLYFERYAKELAPKWLMFRDPFLMKNILGEPVLAAAAERGIEFPE